MNSQLREVLDSLHDANVDYWVSDGTLLGLVREGRLLEGDGDIDLCTWNTNRKQIEEWITTLPDDVQTISRRYYGTLGSFKLIRENWRRPVNIKLFKISDKFAWSWAHRYDESTDSLREILAKVYFHYHRTVNSEVRVPTRPTNVIRVKTFCVPKEYYQSVTYSEELQCIVPEQYEAFLEYKYGDWETPTDDWDWWVDDGAIRDASPLELELV